MSFHLAPYFQRNIPKIAAAAAARALGVAIFVRLWRAEKVFKCDRERDWILNIGIM